MAFGRPNVIHAALLDGPASRNLLARVDAWRAYWQRCGRHANRLNRAKIEWKTSVLGTAERMTETKNTGGKTLSVAPRKPLSLKRSGVERDTVRQSFSHGRTNTVQVERKKRRVSPPAEVKAEAPVRAAPEVATQPGGA